MADKKTKTALKERALLSTEFDHDVSYSLWRRGAGHRAVEPARQPGGLLL